MFAASLETFMSPPLQAFIVQVNKHWNPPCDKVPNAVVTVEMQINRDGTLVGSPKIVKSVNSDRLTDDEALLSVYQGAPYPVGLPDKTATVTFYSRKVCPPKAP